MFCHGGPWYSLFFSRGLAQARRPEELAESQRPETGRVRGERVTIVLFFYSELCYATNRDPRAAESPKDAHESPKKKKTYTSCGSLLWFPKWLLTMRVCLCVYAYFLEPDHGPVPYRYSCFGEVGVCGSRHSCGASTSVTDVSDRDECFAWEASGAWGAGVFVRPALLSCGLDAAPLCSPRSLNPLPHSQGWARAHVFPTHWCFFRCFSNNA